MDKICKQCGQRLPLTSFWRYKKPNTKFRINKELIYYHTCKNCCLKKINPYDIKTVLPLLEEMNIDGNLENLAKELIECLDIDGTGSVGISNLEFLITEYFKNLQKQTV